MNDHSPVIALLLPDLRGGGAERVNINLANEFVARGFAVDMLLLDAAGEFMPLLHSSVRVIDLRAGRIRAAIRPLVRYFRQTPPAAMLACMWPLTILAVAARVAASARSRVVVAEHTNWTASRGDIARSHWFFLKLTARIAYPRADGVVTVSKGAAADLAGIAGLPQDRVVVIYNPVVGGAKPVFAKCLEATDEWRLASHHRILAVGALKEIKDYVTLLRAFAILRENIQAKLLILGEGSERPVLERLIVDLGIGADVYMPGFAADPEPYFKTADLHVLSSAGEGFGNVIVEALDAGTPVVSTDCPSGPREILADGRFGTLVPVADPAALARAMQDSLGRVHDKDVLRARAGEFNVDKAADAYLDILLPGWRRKLASAGERL